MRLSSCCLSMPHHVSGATFHSRFLHLSRFALVWSRHKNACNSPLREDNARSSCASLALGVMWHRRNALEYALPFYLLVWTLTTAKTSDTKIPVCSIRAGALSAWSLTHKKRARLRRRPPPPPPQPYHPPPPFHCKCRSAFSEESKSTLSGASSPKLKNASFLQAIEGLAREKG